MERPTWFYLVFILYISVSNFSAFCVNKIMAVAKNDHPRQMNPQHFWTSSQNFRTFLSILLLHLSRSLSTALPLLAKILGKNTEKM